MAAPQNPNTAQTVQSDGYVQLTVDQKTSKQTMDTTGHGYWVKNGNDEFPVEGFTMPTGEDFKDENVRMLHGSIVEGANYCATDLGHQVLHRLGWTGVEAGTYGQNKMWLMSKGRKTDYIKYPSFYLLQYATDMPKNFGLIDFASKKVVVQTTVEKRLTSSGTRFHCDSFLAEFRVLVMSHASHKGKVRDWKSSMCQVATKAANDMIAKLSTIASEDERNDEHANILVAESFMHGVILGSDGPLDLALKIDNDLTVDKVKEMKKKIDEAVTARKKETGSSGWKDFTGKTRPTFETALPAANEATFRAIIVRSTIVSMMTNKRDILDLIKKEEKVFKKALGVAWQFQSSSLAGFDNKGWSDMQLGVFKSTALGKADCSKLIDAVKKFNYLVNDACMKSSVTLESISSIMKECDIGGATGSVLMTNAVNQASPGAMRFRATLNFLSKVDLAALGWISRFPGLGVIGLKAIFDGGKNTSGIRFLTLGHCLLRGPANMLILQELASYMRVSNMGGTLYSNLTKLVDSGVMTKEERDECRLLRKMLDLNSRKKNTATNIASFLEAACTIGDPSNAIEKMPKMSDVEIAKYEDFEIHHQVKTCVAVSMTQSNDGAWNGGLTMYFKATNPRAAEAAKKKELIRVKKTFEPLEAQVFTKQITDINADIGVMCLDDLVPAYNSRIECSADRVWRRYKQITEFMCVKDDRDQKGLDLLNAEFNKGLVNANRAEPVVMTVALADALSEVAGSDKQKLPMNFT